MNAKMPMRGRVTSSAISRARAAVGRRCAMLCACGLLGVVAATASVPANAGAVHKDAPGSVDPNAKYLFYMHGAVIEHGGPQARTYNYSGILKALAARGFEVIGEERSQVRSEEYAEKVAGQVKQLLDAGVPAKNITVAGHSKGGMIAMFVMVMIRNPEIAYVNFAGCGKPGGGLAVYSRFAENRAAKARGRFLSAYDKNDQIAGSCKEAMEKMVNATVMERVLDNGRGHELFYNPSAEWLDILQAWAERQRP